MSEDETRNPRSLPQARWVKAKVVEDEPQPPRTPGADPAGETPPTPVPPPSEEDLAGARWFSIVFLVVVVPLGLIVLVLMIWAAISNIPSP